MSEYYELVPVDLAEAERWHKAYPHVPVEWFQTGAVSGHKCGIDLEAQANILKFALADPTKTTRELSQLTDNKISHMTVAKLIDRARRAGILPREEIKNGRTPHKYFDVPGPAKSKPGPKPKPSPQLVICKDGTVGLNKPRVNEDGAVTFTPPPPQPLAQPPSQRSQTLVDVEKHTRSNHQLADQFEQFAAQTLQVLLTRDTSSVKTEVLIRAAATAAEKMRLLRDESTKTVLSRSSSLIEHIAYVEAIPLEHQLNVVEGRTKLHADAEPAQLIPADLPPPTESNE